MTISSNYLIELTILVFILLTSYLILKLFRDPSKIIKILFNLKFFFLLKKDKTFFTYMKDLKISKLEKKILQHPKLFFFRKKNYYKYFLKKKLKK